MLDVICIKLREKLTDICEVQAKDFYTELVNKKKNTIMNKYMKKSFSFFRTKHLKEIFLLPFKILVEPFYQSFQYKLYTGKKLEWKIITSSTCSFCGAVDTLKHHLYYSYVSTIFLEELSK